MAEDYSIVTGKKATFGTVDYVLFALMFVFSAAIGFYHAFRDRNKKNVDEFQLGGRKMHPIPVSLSLTATFLSALTVLGTPAEVYTNNTMYIWIIVAMFLATGGAAHLFIPVFYNLNITSCFQYLEMRFGKLVRTVMSIFFMLQTLVYMGFVLYAPSLAFEAVTNVSLWGSMIAVAAVCTLYTTLGGMKTVLWTDSLQLTVMFAGLICVLVEGSKAAGGFSTAWNTAANNGRVYFTDFSPDPRTRHSVWTVSIGGGLFWMYLYGVNQAQVQRACSLPSLRRSQLALWINFPGLVIIMILCVLIGVVMYAFYSQCDPIKFGLIDRRDQLLPLFVLDVLIKIPGLSGIFMACVFSGGLSTISSGLNAMSTVLLEDFIKPFCCASFVKKRGMILSKVLVVVIGVIQFGVAVLISQFKGLILQFSYSMYSILAGPLFGVFVSGMFFPWTNKWGVLVGFILSLAFMCWMGIGTILAKLSGSASPVSTTGCNNNATGNLTPAPSSVGTFSTSSIAPVTTAATSSDPLDEFYRISYLWYTGLGMMITIIISLVVSFITGHTKASSVNSDLMCPVFDRLFPYLPEAIRKPLRFGVVYEKSKYGIKEQKDIAVAHVYDNDITVSEKKISVQDNGAPQSENPNVTQL